MTPEEYKAHLSLVWMAAQAVEDLPLTAMLESMERADRVGPILDPSLWIRNHGVMDEDRRIVEAALGMQECIKAMRANRDVK
ncbi:MAG: hypothetical protein WD533_06570 [Dehalococcoidia bacterium]